MKAIETGMPGLPTLEPGVFGDDRGLSESVNSRSPREAPGVEPCLVQYNHSRPTPNVPRVSPRDRAGLPPWKTEVFP